MKESQNGGAGNDLMMKGSKGPRELENCVCFCPCTYGTILQHIMVSIPSDSLTSFSLGKKIGGRIYSGVAPDRKMGSPSSSWLTWSTEEEESGAGVSKQPIGQQGDLALFFSLLWLPGLHSPKVCVEDKAEHEKKGTHSVRQSKPHGLT